MKNCIIRYNLIRNVNKEDVTTGNGITLSAEVPTEKDHYTGFEVYGNIMIGLDGNGISTNFPDLVKIHNNVIADYGRDKENSEDIGGYGIKVYTDSNLAPEVDIYNNVILNISEFDKTDYNTQYFISISGGKNVQEWPDVRIDHNLYYPEATSGKCFNIAKYFVHGDLNDMQEAGYDLKSFNAHPYFKVYPPLTDIDCYPQSNSPLIDNGIELNMSTDYNGTKIFKGIAPDIGAWEYLVNNNSIIIEPPQNLHSTE